jgi:hypothetical protein
MAVGAKTCRPCQNMTSRPGLTPADHRLLRVSFTTIQKSNSCTAVIKQNTTENIIISHAQNVTALQPHVFLTGIHRLLVTDEWLSCFPPAQKKKKKKKNKCQGQLQTPESLSSFYRKSQQPSDLVTRPQFSDALGNKFFWYFVGDELQWLLESADSVAQ